LTHLLNCFRPPSSRQGSAFSTTLVCGANCKPSNRNSSPARPANGKISRLLHLRHESSQKFWNRWLKLRDDCSFRVEPCRGETPSTSGSRPTQADRREVWRFDLAFPFDGRSGAQASVSVPRSVHAIRALSPLRQARPPRGFPVPPAHRSPGASDHRDRCVRRLWGSR
jgi:hypothetical protein